jgi:hypothetical protein
MKSLPHEPEALDLSDDDELDDLDDDEMMMMFRQQRMQGLVHLSPCPLLSLSMSVPHQEQK